MIDFFWRGGGDIHNMASKTPNESSAAPCNSKSVSRRFDFGRGADTFSSKRVKGPTVVTICGFSVLCLYN